MIPGEMCGRQLRERDPEEEDGPGAWGRAVSEGAGGGRGRRGAGSGPLRERVLGRAEVWVGPRGRLVGPSAGKGKERGEGWACELGCWVGHWAEMVWGLGSFSDPFPFLFLFLSKSNPNSNSRQMNSNLNLNSHKHSTNKTMLQHDATTKIKPMINFNYLQNKILD